MTYRIAAAVLALALAGAFAAPSFAQDAGKKMAAGKTEAAKPLKWVACPSPCDFTVKSHDEKELVSIVKAHAKKMHKMEMTDKQVKEMVKTESMPAKS